MNIDVYDEAYPAHEKCPRCTSTPTYPPRPSGSGTLATCLRCGHRFVIHESGSELVGPKLGPNELGELRAASTA
jgi:hypothetical protein